MGNIFKVIGLLLCSWVCGTLHAQMKNGVIDVMQKGEKINHYWSFCVGAGRANEGLRASWLEHLRMVKEDCGFQYCRFHGLLHDDMFVYKEEGGKVLYNWQYMDDLFDRMLAIGVKPFVEFGFMPKALASGDKTQFWWKGNITPPNDYDKWALLLAACVRHWIDRYGVGEVRSWYFEIWNEPNLSAFWTGTKSEYFKMYKYSVKAIKAVDENLRVGGPATSNFVPDGRFDGEREDVDKHITHLVPDLDALHWQGAWIKDFLDFCKQENLPVDFVSCHPYPTDTALNTEGKKKMRIRGKDSTYKDMLWLRKVIGDSAYPQAEIHLTEWNSSPSPRDLNHDRISAAAFIIKSNVEGIGLVNSMSYWTFTDVFEEGGAGNSIYHGGFGMINYQGIVKPSYHAYRMLNQLGDELLIKNEGCVVTRNSKTNKIIALIYHYPKEELLSLGNDADVTEQIGKPETFSLTFKGIRQGTVFQISTLDKEHGYAYPIWRRMGSPETPTLTQTEILRNVASSLNEETYKVSESSWVWKQVLEPWACILIKEL